MQPMKKKFLTTIAAALVVGSWADAALDIIPLPLSAQENEGSYQLKSDAVIAYASEEAKAPAEMLAMYLRQSTGFDLAVVEGKQGAITLVINDAVEAKEGYLLDVSEGVKLEASTAQGLFYAAQTLRQLLPAQVYAPTKQDQTWSIPQCNIKDAPRFAWRGIHLDVSRHFMPKDDVLKFIDTLATLKINTLHMHLTDDQGWRIEIKKWPKLTEVGAWRKETLIGHRSEKPRKFDGKPHGGFYTHEDIRELVAYAEERHITIVPEIDMPGHMQAAIAAYPELGCTDGPTEVRTEWGISSDILNPEESTVQFCKDVLTEVIELFPSEFIHVGGDEAHKKYWESSQRVQELIKERGLKDEHEMQSWFIKQMDDFLVSKGRRLIGWDEITEGGLAPNAAVMWWRGKAIEEVKHAIAAGHDVVVANSGALYFDKYQSASKDKKKTEPLAIGGAVTLDKVYNFEPTAGLGEKAAQKVLGAQGQLWREYIPTTEQLEYMAFPRACALAEMTWLPRENLDYQGFLKRLPTQEQRFEAAGVNYRKQK